MSEVFHDGVSALLTYNQCCCTDPILWQITLFYIDLKQLSCQASDDVGKRLADGRVNII